MGKKCMHCKRLIDEDSFVYVVDDDIVHFECLKGYLESELGLREKYLNSDGELE